jgi:hypothetical protein
MQAVSSLSMTLNDDSTMSILTNDDNTYNAVVYDRNVDLNSQSGSANEMKALKREWESSSLKDDSIKPYLSMSIESLLHNTGVNDDSTNQ